MVSLLKVSFSFCVYVSYMSFSLVFLAESMCFRMYIESRFCNQFLVIILI
jgi:hypothetical protein